MVPASVSRRALVTMSVLSVNMALISRELGQTVTRLTPLNPTPAPE
jgi:hypothetical protein